MAIVYQATNRINGKRYIGVTRKTLDQRRVAHEAKARQDAVSRLHAAIRKYGPDVFVWTVLEIYESYDAAISAEIRLIAERKPEYNVLPGGERGWSVSPETRERIAAAKRGKKASPETRAKMSKAHKGKKMPLRFSELLAQRNRERVWTPASRNRVRQSLAGKPHSPERRAKAAAGQVGRKPTRQRPVICLDDGRRFFSARDADRAYGMPRDSVLQICIRQPKRSKYKRFAFLTDAVVVVSMIYSSEDDHVRA